MAIKGSISVHFETVKNYFLDGSRNFIARCNEAITIKGEYIEKKKIVFCFAKKN